MSIEQAMDYDAVVVPDATKGNDLETTLEKCRQAGITSFTIYDTTLNKMTQRGECSLITRLGQNSIIHSSILIRISTNIILSASRKTRMICILMN